MRFLDCFTYSSIDSEWDASGTMKFRFNLDNAEGPFEANVDFMVEETNIWINFMVRYKPARFFRDLQLKKQFYTSLSEPSFKRADIERYSQEKHESEIFSVIRGSDDHELSYYDLGEDFFNDTIDDLGGIKSIFHALTKKIFETRSM